MGSHDGGQALSRARGGNDRPHCRPLRHGNMQARGRAARAADRGYGRASPESAGSPPASPVAASRWSRAGSRGRPHPRRPALRPPAETPHRPACLLQALRARPRSVSGGQGRRRGDGLRRLPSCSMSKSKKRAAAKDRPQSLAGVADYCLCAPKAPTKLLVVSSSVGSVSIPSVWETPNVPAADIGGVPAGAPAGAAL